MTFVTKQFAYSGCIHREQFNPRLICVTPHLGPRVFLVLPTGRVTACANLTACGKRNPNSEVKYRPPGRSLIPRLSVPPSGSPNFI